jgi:hypothetical protein
MGRHIWKAQWVGANRILFFRIFILVKIFVLKERNNDIIITG